MSVAIGKKLTRRCNSDYPHYLAGRAYRLNYWPITIVSNGEFNSKLFDCKDEFMFDNGHMGFWDETFQTDSKRYSLLFYKLNENHYNPQFGPYYLYKYFRATKQKIKRVGWERWLFDNGVKQ